MSAVKGMYQPPRAGNADGGLRRAQRAKDFEVKRSFTCGRHVRLLNDERASELGSFIDRVRLMRESGIENPSIAIYVRRC